MSEAIVVEASNLGSVNFDEGFFDLPPIDSRYLATCFKEFYVTNSLANDAKTIKFMLPEETANNFYMLHNAFLVVRARLAKKDNSKPDDGKKVAPINNIMYSLFDDVEIRLNGIKVAQDSTHYHYKTYLQLLLAFSATSKQAELQGAGWYHDTHSKFNDLDANGG